MQNFHLHFSYPWLLLLLVLAAVLTLIPYFRLSKRYRRTRNRITSIVLHLIVMTLAIVTLAGLEFRYQLPNEGNEIILLVDVSETEETVKDQRDDFIQLVLDDSKYDNFKVGIVTFGFDQEYAVPLTNEIESIYDTYLEAPLPDTSATNIAAALEYTKTLFGNPQTAKIVLITDGKETDLEMTSVVRAIAAQGTKVDVAYISSEYEKSDVQLMDVELPSTHINQNEDCKITLTLQSKIAMAARIELSDNGTVDASTGVMDVELNAGTQTLSFIHQFKGQGLHKLQFKITEATDDTLSENNTYSSYLYLEVFNNLLIIEREEGTSDALVEMLNVDNEQPYEVTVKQASSTDLPQSVDQLRAYDQVILNDVANANLPKGFAENLQSYVADFGGGVFTVGGEAAYDRKDMYGTTYQEMLPVQAINYTPPVGVIVIIDRSGSMASSDNYGNNKLDWAKAGAASCLQALSERDYIGIMTLDDVEATILGLTPRTQESRILEAINSIEEANGGTIWTEAIDRAGQALRTLKNVAKRHIIVVTDGEIADARENYESIIKGYYETDGITLSVVGIDMASSGDAYDCMKEATEWGGGQLYVTSADQLINKMREDLNAPAIKQVNHTTFNPIAYNLTSPLLKGVELGTGVELNKLTTTLGGFYGVKVRTDAELVLVGDYNVPIYAQWAYGEGMVGSFMCDLQSSDWSSAFMADANGQRFIRNAINALMPSENIRPSQIDFDLKEDNYTNQLSVYTELKDGEYIKGELIEYVDGEQIVTSLNEVTPGDAATLRGRSAYVTAALNEANDYSRCDFVVKASGVYRIVLTKYDANGKVVKNVTGEDVTAEVYKAFSYSEEYNLFLDEEVLQTDEKLNTVARRGNGAVIEDLNDPVEIFEGFLTEIDKSYDPRVLFMILVIILFLADIAVRKFKFKWPHELIREYKEKKNLKK